MKYLGAKIVAASFLFLSAATQNTIDPQDPRWGWDDYVELKCDEGYNKVANYCVKCDVESGKFFDPVTKMCRTCPEGTEYSEATKTCACVCQPPRSINPDTNQCECPGGKVWLNEKCQCPENKPLWNGRTCVACPPGTTYEPKDMQCYHCPEGFIADPVTHQCLPGLSHK